MLRVICSSQKFRTYGSHISQQIEDSTSLRLRLSLVNVIRQRTRSRKIVRAKAQEKAARSAINSGFFKQPVAGSDGVAHQPAAPPQPAPFLGAQSAVAPVRPSPTWNTIT